jgi:CRISPR-associated protein Csy2
MNRRFILISNLKIQNANAMSSPYTIGFPAMTAWLGGVHAIERKLNATKEFKNVKLTSVAVSSHEFDLQTHRGERDYISSIIGTSNPIMIDGSRSSFLEEARCHLTVSILIEFNGISGEFLDDLCDKVKETLICMKMASGDVLGVKSVKVCAIDDESDDSGMRKMLAMLMPGYVLQERRDLMKKSMQDGLDGIDALLKYLKVSHCSEIDESGKVVWSSKKNSGGWIVPIAVGFNGVSDVGIAENQRDSETLHRFAESIVTLGEFVMPYKVENVDEILWSYKYDEKNNLYLCEQNASCEKQRDFY